MREFYIFGNYTFYHCMSLSRGGSFFERDGVLGFDLFENRNTIFTIHRPFILGLNAVAMHLIVMDYGVSPVSAV